MSDEIPPVDPVSSEPAPPALPAEVPQKRKADDEEGVASTTLSSTTPATTEAQDEPANLAAPSAGSVEQEHQNGVAPQADLIDSASGAKDATDEVAPGQTKVGDDVEAVPAQASEQPLKAEEDAPAKQVEVVTPAATGDKDVIDTPAAPAKEDTQAVAPVDGDDNKAVELSADGEKQANPSNEKKPPAKKRKTDPPTRAPSTRATRSSSKADATS